MKIITFIMLLFVTSGILAEDAKVFSSTACSVLFKTMKKAIDPTSWKKVGSEYRLELRGEPSIRTFLHQWSEDVNIELPHLQSPTRIQQGFVRELYLNTISGITARESDPSYEGYFDRNKVSLNFDTENGRLQALRITIQPL